MNGQTILSAITAEKEKFLAQYEDKSYFKKKSSVFFTDFFNKTHRFGDAHVILTLILILISGFLSAPLSFKILEYIKYALPLRAGDPIEFSIFLFLFVSFILCSTKIITRSITTWKYYSRKKTNSIEQLFAEDFYSSEVSPEIQNMLKLFLPDDSYIELRKRNNKITYKTAELAVQDVIERDALLEEKREVFLTPEEIKQYSYAK